MTVSREVAELAAQAAAEIRRRGWHQGSFMGPGDYDTCSLCAGGAINVAAGHVPDSLPEYDAIGVGLYAEIYIRTHGEPPESLTEWWSIDEYIDGVSSWNDNPARTMDDVLAMFDGIVRDGGMAASRNEKAA